MPEAADPKRLQASFFCNDAVFYARDVFSPKAQFFRDGSDEMADVYARIRSQKPQSLEACSSLLR